MLDLIQPIVSMVLGVVAARDWRRHGQSLLNGFGLILHPWVLGDLAAGFLIIFLVEWLVGGIRIVGASFALPDLSNQAR